MKILIYGAGVIGSLYAVLFKNAGYETYLYARGKRLEALKSKGLLYYKNGQIEKSNVEVLEQLENDDKFDFIFLAVRENQLYQALNELKENSSDIVPLVNSIDDYQKWEDICGQGRIIPGFPGAGGSIHNDILDADLTPAIIQPTTFGEISGIKTRRTDELVRIFKKAHIPCQVVKDMHLWQLCHLAMVVPIADAYYEAKNPQKAGYDLRLMKKTARSIKQNFRFMKKQNGKVSPSKMNLFIYMPSCILTIGMSFFFKSAFGNKFMYEHSMKAPDEMRQLHNQLYGYIGELR